VKFAPNNGQGGCTAIEDAAALANHIKKLNDLSEDLPDTASIEKHLKAFQDLRFPRIKPIDVESRMILRGDTLQGPLESFMVHYVIPNIPEFIENSWAENMVGCVLLDYLPFLKHARMGTMPLNTRLGHGQRDRLLVRAFRALPLIFIFFAIMYIAGPRIEEAQSKVFSIYKARSFSNGALKGSLLNTDGLANVDQFSTTLRGIVEFLTISYTAMIGDPVAFNGLLVVLIDFAPIYGIWVIEGYRRGNVLTFSQL
jgi:hypothetical protein